MQRDASEIHQLITTIQYAIYWDEIYSWFEKVKALSKDLIFSHQCYRILFGFYRRLAGICRPTFTVHTQEGAAI